MIIWFIKSISSLIQYNNRTYAYNKSSLALYFTAVIQIGFQFMTDWNYFCVQWWPVCDIIQLVLIFSAPIFMKQLPYVSLQIVICIQTPHNIWQCLGKSSNVSHHALVHGMLQKTAVANRIIWGFLFKIIS